MSRKYHPKTVTRRILDTLSNSEIETPTGIARKIGYNPKTVAKYIDMLEDLRLIECKKIPIGQKEIRACSIKRKEE